jgi:bifunctional UDP-N-acetylglucosamine pyrophosphorylase / glucosamine-1-phosphate N-acetyltransferase
VAIAIILAAGAGTRMKSEKPKVAFEVLGKPLVRWVVDAAQEAGCEEVVTVLGHGAAQIEPFVSTDTTVVYQAERLGTGHAVMQATAHLQGRSGSIVVLSGDAPLISAQTIRALIDEREATGARAVVLTQLASDPSGYGRIIRADDGSLLSIVEEKDCTPEQAVVKECNGGIYCFDIEALLACLPQLSCENAQHEYYLTDVIALLVTAGEPVQALVADDATETYGINSQVQLASAAKLLQQRINERLMASGVCMLDPTLVWVGPDAVIEPDVTLLPLTFVMGHSVIASGTVVGPNARVFDSKIGSDCIIDETIMTETIIEDEVTCGPRAYLRAGTYLCTGSKVGTHVEIKKSVVGPGSKVPHLSYVGDTTIGADANLGAGTITCNYNGHTKERTIIGDRAFIGSSTMLVAPVTIGADATIGAGSVITADVPDGCLALERSEQRIREKKRK